MITPTIADNTMIHKGTMSGFGSGIGIATIFTSLDSIVRLDGRPMCGTCVIRAKTIVDMFSGMFGAIYMKCKQL